MTRDPAQALTNLLNEDPGPNSARIAVLAVCRGNDAWTIGLARDGCDPPDPASRFLTYSITKTMSAAAVLRLAARGVLDLDAPLDRWLPDFGPAGRITLAQVLAHRAALHNYGGMPLYHAAVRSGAEPWTEDEFLTRCRADHLYTEPGREFSYSNIGYLLVKRVLERATGLSFAEVLTRELFQPLGIDAGPGGPTVPTRREDLDPLLFGPSPYLGSGDGGDGTPVLVVPLYHPGWVSHGVVAASALDTARVLHGLFTGALLPPDLLSRMTQAEPVIAPMRDRPWVEPAYGLGLMVELDGEAGPFWGHTGGGPGCTPVAYHVPGPSPLTIAVFTDGEDGAQAEWMAVEAAHALR